MTEIPPSRTRLTGEARARLAADLKQKYTAGATIRELADETQYSPTAIGDLLREAGTTMRPRGFQRKTEAAE